MNQELDPQVMKKIAALEHMNVHELRAHWQELIGRPAPKTFKAPFLRRRLACAIQDQTYGGLPDDFKQKLDQVYAQWQAQQLNKQNDDMRDQRHLPAVGSILSRDYQGITYEVKVLADGFEMLGQHYKSLSAVARTITGTRWNGPAFFGLRSRRKVT